MKIVAYVAVEQEPFACDHLGWRQGLEALGIEYKFVDPCFNNPTTEKLLWDCVEFKPDMVIHGMTNTISNDLPRKVKEALPYVKQVFGMWDYRPEMDYEGLMEVWKESAPYLDLVTISSYTQLPYWQEIFKRVEYLPHGSYIPDELEYDESYKHKVVFTGTRHHAGRFAERVKFIDKLSDLIKPLQITWINETDRTLRNEVWKSLPKLYHSSDICLDISHFWDADGYCSGRSFYMSALGGCAITKRFPRCEELWPKGTKHYFDTPEEARDLILNLTPEQIKETKLNAWNYSKSHHHYKERIWQLIQWCLL